MEITPLRKREQTDLLIVNGLLAEICKDRFSLEKRAKDASCLHQFRVAFGLLKSALDKVMETVPEHQRNTLIANMQNSVLHLEVTPRMATSNCGYTYVHNDDFNTVLAHAVHGSCSTCLGSVEEMRDCDLRKALATVSLDWPRLDDSGHCGYWGMDVVEAKKTGLDAK